MEELSEFITHPGFWLLADVPDDNYPFINDDSIRMCQKTSEQSAFIKTQMQEEIWQRHVSESFSQELLLGIYSISMHTVPKPNTDKLCLAVDHTASKYFLNLMIKSDSIKGTKLDSLHSLGASLL
ncbi:hypothetical protein BDR06DRAFT_886728 [Suillus hirtellus]|nr:hypothetical protein BDR06DRAFT_886728 [Suillus hirtellus]